jgi:hypothetical protein
MYTKGYTGSAVASELFLTRKRPHLFVKLFQLRDHSFKTSACLRGGGVSPCADGPKVTVHKDQKSPS